MTPPTREETLQQYQSLPPDLQEAIVSTEAADKNGEIKEQFQLSQEETVQLTDEIGLVLLGFTPLKGFESSLAKRLDLPEQTVQNVAKVVEERVFAPVRRSLKQIQPAAEPQYGVQDPYREPVEEEQQAQGAASLRQSSAAEKPQQDENGMKSRSAKNYNFPHASPPNDAEQTRTDAEPSSAPEQPEQEEKQESDSLDAQLLRETRTREDVQRESNQREKKAPAPPNLPTGENGQQRPSQDGGQGRKSNADPYREPIE